MTIRVSSGLRSSMVWSYGINTMMDYGHIRIYGGAEQPISADNPPTGDLLGFVSTDGLTPIPGEDAGGLRMSLVAPGTLGKSGDWVLKGTATGTVMWWRFVWNLLDPGEISDYYPRIDGAVGESLFLTTDQITPSTGIPIAGFTLLLPYQ